MKMISVKCPECGADVQVEEGKTKYFCSYCGTPLYFDDGVKREVHEHVYHEVNEADIRRAEAYEEIEKQRLDREAELKKHQMDIENERRSTARDYIIVAIVMAIFIYFMIRDGFLLHG